MAQMLTLYLTYEELKLITNRLTAFFLVSFSCTLPMRN